MAEITALDVYREVREAEARIRGFVRETPLEHDVYLGQLGECNVYLKLENVQVTGSFKSRGAFNRLLTLGPEELKEGVVTASTGNHGAAFTYAANRLGYSGLVYVPENVSSAKLELLKLYGAQLAFHGTDTVETESFARKSAEQEGKFFLSPYNDLMVLSGQGTVAAEIRRQLEVIDAVLVPVGGGGLMAGMAGYLKRINEKIEVIGCQPARSPVMAESVKAGKIIEMESKPTLSDGTAGGIEPGSITFPLCRDYVDDFIIASELEIKHAMRLLLEKHYMVVEGAAALAVACFIKEKERFKDKNVVLVLTGKKVSTDIIKQILCEG